MGGISLTLFNELQLFGWVTYQEVDKIDWGRCGATILENSLIRVIVAPFGYVGNKAITIANPAGRDAIIHCFGQRTIHVGGEGSYREDVYYNSFSSTGTWITGNYFYLKPGQTLTCQQNYNSTGPIACYISAK